MTKEYAEDYTRGQAVALKIKVGELMVNSRLESSGQKLSRGFINGYLDQVKKYDIYIHSWEGRVTRINKKSTKESVEAVGL